MKGRNYYIRKAHRYLGVFIGFQFLLWTLGGIYFSWTDLDQIHGDHLRHPSPSVEMMAAMTAPSEAIRTNAPECASADLTRLKVVSIRGETYYAVMCAANGREQPVLLRTTDGRRRESVSESDARAIASEMVHPPSEIESVELITDSNMTKHHEYREKPLPAWAVTFRNVDGLTVYISAADGQIHAMRTNGWRVFDLLWMMHTMDFAGRDNINNYLLRAFSLLGIVTVASGFLLFLVSSRNIRRLIGRRR